MLHAQERELLAAARRGDEYEVNELLEEADPPVDVDARDENDWTSLMWAAANGHYDVMNQLLESGADVDVQDANGATAFLRAAEFGHADAVSLLWSYHTCVSYMC